MAAHSAGLENMRKWATKGAGSEVGDIQSTQELLESVLDAIGLDLTI